MRPALASVTSSYSRRFTISPIRHLPSLEMWGSSLSTVVRPAARHQAYLGRRAYIATKPFQGAAAALALRKPIPAQEPEPELPLTEVDGRRVAVQWSSDLQSRFHHIWLRDHCRCSECFHPITKQRMLDTFSIPADIQPRAVDATGEGLVIQWASPHEHTSLYPWSWLKNNSYDPQQFAPKPDWQKPIIWDNRTIRTRTPTVEYYDVMENDDALYDWLAKIKKWGVCFVRGVPADLNSTEALARRISFIRETQYGKMWSFTSDLAHGDTAYTNIALPAHTDNTYFTDPAGLQIFHLLEHTGGTGGETLLVDGLHVAREVRRRYPRSFELLSQVPIPCHAAGDEDTFYRPDPNSGYPVLSVDASTGEVWHVRWNNNDRSVVNAVHPDLMEAWYQAIRDWNRCLTEPSAEYWVKLQPRTVVVIDNQRVMHGRAEFTGRRQLCGAYMGKDDFMSRLRVLWEKGEAGALDVHERRNVWSPGL